MIPIMSSVLITTLLICLLCHISKLASANDSVTIIDDYTQFPKQLNKLGYSSMGEGISNTGCGYYIPEDGWWAEMFSSHDQCNTDLTYYNLELYYFAFDAYEIEIEYHEKHPDCQGTSHKKTIRKYVVNKGLNYLNISLDEFRGANPTRAYAIVIAGPIILKQITKVKKEIIFTSGTTGVGIYPDFINLSNEWYPLPLSKTSQASKETSGMYTSCIESNTIALTYEEGPDPLVTPQLLDILKESSIRATFFMLGQAMKNNRNLVNHIFEEGHHLASLSDKLVDLTQLSREELLNDITNAEIEIIRVTSSRPRFFRPPFGLVNKEVMSVLEERGYNVISWNIDTLDWHKASNENNLLHSLMNGIKGQLPNSYIVRQRGVGPMTATTINRVIDIIKRKNMRPVPMYYCINDHAYESLW